MTAHINMKGRDCLLLILLLSSLMVQAQNNKPRSFKDYPFVSNLDSFERVIEGRKNNSEQYLYDLITFEINRRTYKDWFGQDLNTIKTLAYQAGSPLAIATYNYLQGFYLQKQSVNMSSRHMLEALRYFETAKDTLGAASCYLGLLVLNYGSPPYTKGEMLTPDICVDKIFDLSQQSNDIRMKVIMMSVVAFDEPSVKGKQNFDERVCDVENMLLLMDKNKDNYPALAHAYNAISTFYERYGLVKEEFEYSYKSHELFKKLSSRMCLASYFNLVVAYYGIKNYKKAEELLTAMIPYVENDKQNNIHVYNFLAKIKYENKDYYAAWYYKEKEATALKEQVDKLKNSVIEELKTQYEIDKKETENTLYRIILGIVLSSFVLVGVLMYFLYKSNKKLKRLVLFKDQLFGIIAHDLRAPLTAFQRFSDGVSFLLKKKEYDNIHVLSLSINQLVSNTTLLLDNLLSWYALQNTHVATTKTTFSLYELAKESKALYETIAKDQQSTIEIVMSESLTMDMDKNVLLLILRNLIDNAIKHGKSSQITIKGGVEARHVVIEVINNDTVFCAEKLAVLQKQIQQYSGGVNAGRGLGLYLVCHFVKQYNGSLSVESSTLEGVKFTVRMPTAG